MLEKRIISNGRPVTGRGRVCSESVELSVLLYVHRNRRFIRDGSPGRPPRLSHSSRALWALREWGTCIRFKQNCFRKIPRKTERFYCHTLLSLFWTNTWEPRNLMISLRMCSEKHQNVGRRVHGWRWRRIWFGGYSATNRCFQRAHMFCKLVVYI